MKHKLQLLSMYWGSYQDLVSTWDLFKQYKNQDMLDIFSIHSLGSEVTKHSGWSSESLNIFLNTESQWWPGNNVGVNANVQ